MNRQRRTFLTSAAALAGTIAVAPRTMAKANPIKDLQGAIDKAIQAEGTLLLPAGNYMADGVTINGRLSLAGVPGATLITAAGHGPALIIQDTDDVTITGIGFTGGTAESEPQALVTAKNAGRLRIAGCAFRDSDLSGIRLEGCSGEISGNFLTALGDAAIFALDSRGLTLAENHVEQIRNNGILVWTSEKREDGTIVSGNHIQQITAAAGGSGQNGNGINVFRAGNVMVSGNRVHDCAFSAIRNNSGANGIISGNSISRTGEVAIYVEFGFEGAVIANNMIEDVAFGISVTNFNEGGRLAVVSGNVVRNCKGGASEGVTAGVGIAAEADTTISGNTIENARDTGLSLGWGPYCRDLSAAGNLIRDCGTGIAVSLSEGAQPVAISSNVISGSKRAAIMGMDHEKAVTGDLMAEGADIPERVKLNGNVVR